MGETQCEKVEKCQFLAKYGSSNNLACKGFILMYCKGAKMNECKRKKLSQTGATVPVDMMPNGATITA